MNNLLNFFPNFSNNTKLWFFVCENKLNESQKIQIENSLIQFTNDWQAHGKQLAADFVIYQNQLIIIAVDQSVEAPSGCSIDKAFRLLQNAENNEGISVFNRMLLPVVIDAELIIFTAAEANDAIENNELQINQKCINIWCNNLEEFRNASWIKLSDTWIKNKIKTFIQ